PSTNEDQALVGDVLANDSDPDSALLGTDGRGPVLVGTGPSHGSLQPVLAGGHWTGGYTYTPSANYNGMDSFSYKIVAGTWNGPPSESMSSPNESGTATVSIIIRAVNDAPTATGQSVETNEDTPTPVIVLSAGDVETAAGNLAYNVQTG